MGHRKECIEMTETSVTARDKYDERWPRACKSCGASGAIEWIENGAPMGEGYWPMPMADICANCSELLLCPRCGATNPEEWFESDDNPCPECGWNWGKGDSDYRPGVWSCEGECSLAATPLDKDEE